MKAWGKTYRLNGANPRLSTTDIMTATHIAGITVSHNNDSPVLVRIQANPNSGWSWEHLAPKGLTGEELLPAENVNDKNLTIAIESTDPNTPTDQLKDVIVRIRYVRVDEC